MLPLRLFRSRGFSIANMVTFTFSVGVFGSVFLLAQFFQVVQGESPLESAVRTMPWTMAPMVVAPLAGLMIDRIGARTLIVAGQALLSAGLFWAALASTVDADYALLVAPFAMAGVGMGLTFAPMTAAVMSSVRPEAHGVASGVNNMLRQVGVAMGIAVLASVFAAYGSYGHPASYVDGLRPAVLVGAAVVAVGGLIALWLPGRRRG
jgi:MFS family permease